jgi:hypothetical protein
MLETIFHLSGNTSAAANVLLQEAHPGFHGVPRLTSVKKIVF